MFLGITLDKKLQWGPLVDKLASRLRLATFANKEIKQLTDVDIQELYF